MSIGTYLRRGALKQSLNLVLNVSDENILRIADWAEFFADNINRSRVRFIKEFYRQRHPAITLIKRIMSGVNKKCLDKFFENFIISEIVENSAIREKAIVQGQAPLFTVPISPTMRCNMSCVGCYAKNYPKEDDLPFFDINRVVDEGRKMGVSVFTILGGEPFIRDDIFDLFAKHQDVYFLVYSNGSMINERVAAKLVNCANALVNFSVEGFEKDNDVRRGAGSYEKVMRAMDIMRSYCLSFGYSTCVTRKNAKTVMSDEFVDLMIDKGVLIGWYFLYNAGVRR